MYQYEYKTLSDLAELAERYGVGLSEVILRHETETTERTEEDVHDLMAARLAVFRESIRSGLVDTEKSVSGLVGGDAAKLEAAGARLLGPLPHRAATYAIAINEANAKMFKIVACPTAGSCGILPAALIAAAEILGKSDEECLRPLFTAAGIGAVVARNASVAGLVEVPCVKRNGVYAVMAVTAAEMALAGIKSVIPPDEVIEAMDSIGKNMPVALKETAEGGLAKTRTGMEITKRLTENAI